MNDSQRTSVFLIVLLQVVLLTKLIFGLFCIFSPLWITAGVVGWYEGYDPQNDLLGIGWLINNLFSILLGILLIALSAIGAIWFGIIASVVAFGTSKKAIAPEAQPESNPFLEP